MFLISVLIYFSFSSELFSFHEFVSFLLLFKSSFNPWCSDRMQSVVSIFFYFELCFGPQYVVNFGESSMSYIKEAILLCLGEKFRDIC